MVLLHYILHCIENIIFFNNKQGEGIYLEGDNRTGAGEGDDERIFIDLEKINQNIQKISQ